MFLPCLYFSRWAITSCLMCCWPEQRCRVYTILPTFTDWSSKCRSCNFLRKVVMQLSDKKATLSFSDGSAPIEFPVYQGTVGPDVIDIRKLYGQTDMFTYDPGFLSTAACESGITYIDGDKGELLYRGYPIDQLAQKCDFLDICYLILNGELPDGKQKTEFDSLVTNHTMVHEQMRIFLQGFRRDAHPMRSEEHTSE